jgi:hypothetical protein
MVLQGSVGGVDYPLLQWQDGGDPLCVARRVARVYGLSARA